MVARPESTQLGLRRSKELTSTANDKTQQLADNIRNSIDTGKAATGKLETNDRIIARVTDGIYREPWSAFRELVSNAYDADATKVSVDSDFPFFTEIRISDDGNGMDSQTVADLLTNIGGSSKRTGRGRLLGTVNNADATRSPHGRKLIGKIGIGLFAVAQLTNHFQIITKRKGSRERVSATVRINTYREDAFSDESAESYSSGAFTVVAESVDDLEAHGTTIVLMNIKRAVREKLQSNEVWAAIDEQIASGNAGDIDSVRPPEFHIGRVEQTGGLKTDPQLPWVSSDSPKQKFEKLFDETVKLGGSYNDRADLSHLDNYFKMLWRLSLGSPIEYMDSHPFDLSGKSNICFYKLGNKPKSSADPIDVSDDESLRGVLDLEAGLKDPLKQFSVFIDGVQLFRPVRLSENLQGSKSLGQPLLFTGKVNTDFGGAATERSGGRLAFEAYLYWNSKIIPKESIGALIRVNGASGTLFDPDFLGYQIAEQTRKKQVTCEIFVLEGLDGALNIDRESYNTSHPHYLFIQKWLHNAFRQFATQHKRIGREVRDQTKDAERDRVKTRLNSFTDEVWERMRGADDASPTVETQKLSGGYSLPVSIGGTSISWSENRLKDRPIPQSDRVEALSLVLNAYGVLDRLDVDQRGSLIHDIISVFSDSE